MRAGRIARPRVLIFHQALAPYRVDLFNALATRLELRIVFLRENVPYQSYDQAALRARLRADHRFLGKGFSVLGRDFRFGVAREIAQFEPDVVVTSEFSPLTLAVRCIRLAKPLRHVVWTADNPSLVEGDHLLRRLARRCLLPAVDGMVVYSEETRACYAARFGFGGPFGICPNAQSEEVLLKGLSDALPLSARLADERALWGKKLLLYVGRLAPVKRLDRLLRAFAGACTRHPEAVLALVGEGAERLALERQARAEGIEDRMIFAGHCEGLSLYAWFNLGAAFVLTSEFEPWGAVVNEALVAGMPVVCSDQAGARALISGRNGSVVDAADQPALQASLGDWLQRTAPLVPAQVASLRRPLMTQSFEDAVSGFVSLMHETLAPQPLEAPG